MTVVVLFMLRGLSPRRLISALRQSSMSRGVIASSFRAPNAGSSSALTIER
ncbi:MAG: hypothetical protein ACR2NB_15215 [Solirubrobacteraceae bacterium]